MQIVKHRSKVLLGFFLCLLAECSDLGQVVPTALRCPDVPVLHSGEATFYTFASGAGSCSFDSTPGDLMVGAINISDYAGSQLCGARLIVEGPKGFVQIRIVDLCPECPPGNIDLSPQAFSLLADTTVGRIPVRWQVVANAVDSPIVYHFHDSSNVWWTAVQVRNHRYPIYGVEYLTAEGGFKAAQRT